MSKLKERSIALLQNKLFQETFICPDNTHFPLFVKSKFDEYLSIINNKDFWNEFIPIYYNKHELGTEQTVFIPMIRGLCENIIKCLNNYYDGKTHQAYNDLVAGLDSITFKTGKLYTEGFGTIEAESLNLYRLRKREDHEFLPKELFHIPFDKRERIDTQRYSIPGHPSLYAGDSIFVCWAELNQPSIKDVYACRLTNAKGLKIIELIQPQDLASRISLLEDDVSIGREIFRFIFMFPVIAASSFKTINPLAKFKSQYIIPQLFLQYVRNNHTTIDGIKYFSTRIDYKRIKNIGIYNYVFPTVTRAEKDYCKDLISKFKLTNPFLWEYEEISRAAPSAYVSSGFQSEKMLELNQGIKKNYEDTVFSEIEIILNHQNIFSLTDI